MVPLPLFKLASLFVRHVSKYGANRIKMQAHDHPRFRTFAARYGQMIHQLNMRLSVALLRNVEAEIRAKEKAEAPTVETKEEMEKRMRKEEAQKLKGETTAGGEGHQQQQQQQQSDKKSAPRSVWRRKFRALPESKAVDLFADVVGDTFILVVAGALIIYEYQRSSQKPDANMEKMKELRSQVEELKKREEVLEDEERRHASRILTLEQALRNYKDPKTKQPLLPSPPPTA